MKLTVLIDHGSLQFAQEVGDLDRAIEVAADTVQGGHVEKIGDEWVIFPPHRIHAITIQEDRNGT